MKELKETLIKESPDVELLGLVVDNNLSFKKNIAKLYQTASCKLRSLNLNLRKKQNLGKCFCGFSI